MRRRSRLGALFVAFSMFLGLGVLSVVNAPVASADPLLGTRDVTFRCDDGAYHASITWNYTVTFIRNYAVTPSSPPTDTSEYNFKLNSAHYISATYLSQGPKLFVEFAGSTSPLWLSAASGSANTTGIFWTGVNGANPPETTRTVNQSGGALPTFMIIRTHPGNTENRIKTTWQSHLACEQYMSLARPGDMTALNFPQTGTHTLVAECGSQTIRVNYTIADKGWIADGAVTRKNETIVMNSATYEGPPVAHGAKILVTAPKGDSAYTSLGGTSNPSIFVDGTSGPVTQTNGFGGFVYPPIALTPANVNNEDAIRIKVQFNNTSVDDQTCITVFGLDRQDKPATGNSGILNGIGCTADGSNVVPGSGAGGDTEGFQFLQYEVLHTGNDAYTFQLLHAMKDSFSTPTPTVTTDMTLVLIDSNGVSTNVLPTPGVTGGDVSWDNGPVVPFNYTQGNDSMPRLKATISHLNAPDCSSYRNLSFEFSGTPQSSIQTIPFDDCRPGVTQPHGNLTLNANWTKDNNEDRVRLNYVSIDNNSSADLSLPGGIPHTVKLVTDGGIGDNLTFMEFGSWLTGGPRYWSATTAHNLDITSNALWSSYEPDDMISAPGNQHFAVEETPALVLSFSAWDFGGAPCTAMGNDLKNIVLDSPL